MSIAVPAAWADKGHMAPVPEGKQSKPCDKPAVDPVSSAVHGAMADAQGGIGQ